MFLLLTGASGVGKSTARRYVEAELGDVVHCAELRDVAAVPAVPTIEWRNQATEAAVRAALSFDRPHFLLASDPVAVGELLAVPSAPELDGIAACLLDARPDVQTARLTARGDDPALLPNHVAFADWMRAHASDPQHMQHVLTGEGWEAMQWARWTELPTGDPRWQVTVVDTSDRTPDEVGRRVVAWVRAAIEGRAPRLTALHTSSTRFT
ncbi:AAA family ATPase [Pseudonocardia sp. DSM 110487]|uniref:AAA family ATPase n=1 Tax=Pseudonocardia sp. DSM 110487 TaxID=2865833 RepID=UPI001C6A8537|nr:AAA family ATPase [Pseudonocardia sp. DSM 110487]QYN36706.1 AAA family ATPase [Pseudonocardia sp. DSM 110487]